MLTFCELVVMAAMTDDSQSDTQPDVLWSFDPLAGCDSQPVEAGYVWTAPIGPTPEQAKEAEQARVWALIELFARGG